MHSPRFHVPRTTAVVLVLISGIMILGLSLILQVIAWELRGLLYHRFGWETNTDLPVMTSAFIKAFSYRPEEYLTVVGIWFFWPFVLMIAHCHFRYRDPVEFTSAFLFGFVCSWLLVGFGIILVLTSCSMSFVILLAELRPTPIPVAVSLISPISWTLPFLVLLFIGWEYLHASKKSRAADNSLNRCNG